MPYERPNLGLRHLSPGYGNDSSESASHRFTLLQIQPSRFRKNGFDPPKLLVSETHSDQFMWQLVPMKKLERIALGSFGVNPSRQRFLPTNYTYLPARCPSHN